MLDLPRSNDERLVVGAEDFSDAGVFRVAPDLLMVQSLDFFAPLVDDPFLFGQIAAANSLSDIFACGATPITALNIVCFPDNKLGLDVLQQILKGGTDKVHEAGATVVGGHSIRDNEIKYGLSVTGQVTPDRLITNSGAQAGDVLVLTKKLGTGFVTTALKKKKCADDVAQAAMQGMAMLNRVASQAASAMQANAVTDITGFGLAVHACELAQASGVSLSIEMAKLPILPGAKELCQRGFYTRANETNRNFCGSQISFPADADSVMMDLVFDPQTSGGLLISIPAENAAELVDQINQETPDQACLVGSVLPKSEVVLTLV